MILYLGTSGLAKLYIEERGSADVRLWVKEAEIVATCRIAYTEIVSALEIRLRRKDFTGSEFKKVMEALARDWPRYATVDFDEIETGRLMIRYGLRRFDAIHLSAARLIHDGAVPGTVVFASFDDGLNRAAQREGLCVLPWGADVKLA